MSEMNMDAMAQVGVTDEAELTPAKLGELHAEGGSNGRPVHQGCEQTFEERHCYWCGKPNCVNPGWPVWFCYNGGHPNKG